MINQVNGEPLQAILEAGYIPIIAPLARHCDDGSENAGSPLNINGDTVAGELAHALEAERLVFLTDVEGILDGSNRLISRLNRRRANILFQSGVVRGGLIPKFSCNLALWSRFPVSKLVIQLSEGISTSRSSSGPETFPIFWYSS